MTGDKPIVGFSSAHWGQIHEHYYHGMPSHDWAAVTLNSYLSVSITAGIIGLFSFVIYLLSMVLAPRYTSKRHPNISTVSLSISKSLLVILIGFCLNGGLSILAIAVPFWVLANLETVTHPYQPIDELAS